MKPENISEMLNIHINICRGVNIVKAISQLERLGWLRYVEHLRTKSRLEIE
jgi:chromosome segregation and condensation protein ScpB